jgi:hypothetical protein
LPDALMAVFVVVVVTSVGAGDGIAKDKVSLPFTCSLDGGRLRVEPSREHSFPIVGQREQQAFTFCPAGEKGRCRTWMVHRFAVQCTGGRVTWPEIVAAAAGHLQNRAVIENGQLLLRLGPRFNDGCAEANRGAGRSGMPPECQLAGYAPARGVMRSHILAMPRGFCAARAGPRPRDGRCGAPKPIQVTWARDQAGSHWRRSPCRRFPPHGRRRRERSLRLRGGGGRRLCRTHRAHGTSGPGDGGPAAGAAKATVAARRSPHCPIIIRHPYPASAPLPVAAPPDATAIAPVA